MDEGENAGMPSMDEGEDLWTTGKTLGKQESVMNGATAGNVTEAFAKNT